MAKEKEKDFIENRQIRIFISSTFKDMQAEREYLVTRIFPGLRKYCEERDISLFELDLRWGITKEDSESQKAFKICLDEVNRTKPFFIGLLGERYGWIPSEEEQRKMEETGIFNEYKWIKDEFKRKISITETEILAGALNSTEKANAYFYFRSSEIMIPDDKEEYKEKSGSHEEKMLIELKNKIKNNKIYPIKDYNNVEHLGKLVEKDFKELIDRMFPNQRALSDLEKERMQQRIFLKTKTRVYIENQEWYNYLNEFADGNDKALCVTSEGGMGKSALLANWIINKKEKTVKDEDIIYHCIGVSQSEGYYEKIIQRIINEIKNIYEIDQKEETKQFNNPQNELEDLLFSIPKHKKLIIILDGLNNLYDINDAKYLNWFPLYPKNIKFIYSTASDDITNEILKRREYKSIEIKYLSIENRKLLIEKYFKNFSKKLSNENIEKIINSKNINNNQTLLTIIDNMRIYGNYDSLDSQIDKITKSGCEEVYDIILQNIEETFNESNISKKMVNDILSIIVLSRNGLSEIDIINISNTKPMYWSQLFGIILEQLLVSNGYITVSNNLFKNAIIKRYLNNETNKSSYRLKIIEYFESSKEVSFMRRCNELPYQLFKIKDWDKLYSVLFNYKVFNYIFNNNIFEIGKYLRKLSEIDKNKYSAEIYLFFENEILDKYELISFFINISYLNIRILYDNSMVIKFINKVIDLCNAENNNKNPILIDIYFKLNTCLSIIKNYEIALEFSKKALKICENVYGENNIKTANSYYNVGDNYSSLGEHETALRYFNETIIIMNKLYGADNIERVKINALIGISNTYFSLKDFNKSLEYNNKIIELLEKHVGKEHPEMSGIYINISNCYTSMNMLDKAIIYSKKALDIDSVFLDKDQISLISSNIALAISYAKNKNYDDAIKYFLTAKDIQKKLITCDHFDVAMLNYQIGLCYNYMNNYKKALDYYEEAYRIFNSDESYKEAATMVKQYIDNLNRE